MPSADELVKMTDQVTSGGHRPPSWLESPPSQETLAHREAEKVLDGLRAKVSKLDTIAMVRTRPKKAAERYPDRTRDTRRKIALSTMTGTHLQHIMRQQLHAA